MHKKLALTPPMGWNSWDCYGAAVNEEQLLADIQAAGTEAYIGKNVDDIVAHVVTHVHPGDVLLVMSNGGFGGIHNKLLIALAQ